MGVFWVWLIQEFSDENTAKNIYWFLFLLWCQIFIHQQICYPASIFKCRQNFWKRKVNTISAFSFFSPLFRSNYLILKVEFFMRSCWPRAKIPGGKKSILHAILLPELLVWLEIYFKVILGKAMILSLLGKSTRKMLVLGCPLKYITYPLQVLTVLPTSRKHRWYLTNLIRISWFGTKACKGTLPWSVSLQ